MKKFAILAALAVTAALTGCGPANVEQYVEVAPNETAFVIPLEGANLSNQGKMMSEAYLAQSKVAAKRIEIPQRERSTGRGPGDFEYIPTVRVIKIDRSPVTREWTKDSATGTSKRDQAISVESVESIDFKIGVTITASIPEEKTAKFLYYYSGKQLQDIIDENVRSYVQSALSAAFGAGTLDQDRKSKAQIFATAFKQTKEYFDKFGIEIDNLGFSEGMTYTDPQIQAAINRTFVAEQTTAATQQKVQQADYEMQAAEKFNQAAQARTAQVHLEIEQMNAQAMLNLSTRITQLPNEVPQGSPLMLGFSTPRSSGSEK
jgi:hypothetical protein